MLKICAAAKPQHNDNDRRITRGIIEVKLEATLAHVPSSFADVPKQIAYMGV